MPQSLLKRQAGAGPDAALALSARAQRVPATTATRAPPGSATRELSSLMANLRLAGSGDGATPAAALGSIPALSPVRADPQLRSQGLGSVVTPVRRSARTQRLPHAPLESMLEETGFVYGERWRGRCCCAGRAQRERWHS